LKTKERLWKDGLEGQKAGKVKGEKRQEKNNQLEMSKDKGKVLN
jgi:hypothetical protein